MSWSRINDATAAELPGNAREVAERLSSVEPQRVRRKVFWRILPFVFLLYIVAYLDRANVGFAELAMAEDLKFSEEIFGLGFGVFFLGYLILEIPGALVVERWNARRWFARILITWGLCSALTAFVRTPAQFYIARFLLGVAEAGFFSGIIVYFTHWFPKEQRARAMSGLIMAVPFSWALGAPISALILPLDWFGLTGWQWMLLLEGLSAVILGFVTLLCLTDRPSDAAWLAAPERKWLTERLAAETSEQHEDGKDTVWQAVRQPNVWLLGLGIFATNTGGYALVFWLPTAVKGMSNSSTTAVLWWSGLIYACEIMAAFLAGCYLLGAVFVALTRLPDSGVRLTYVSLTK